MNQPAEVIKQVLPVDDLAYRIAMAKQAEDSARAERVKLEEQLLEIMPELKAEGSTKEMGQFYRATVTTGVTRKITDPVALSRSMSPEEFEKLVRVKYEINTTTLRSLSEEGYKNVARFIESKPRKPSVKVELLGVAK